MLIYYGGLVIFVFLSLAPPTILLPFSTWYVQTSLLNHLPELSQASVNYFAYLYYSAKFFTAAKHYFSSFYSPMLLLLCVALVNENYHYADPHKMAEIICLNLCLPLPDESRTLSSPEANPLPLHK